MPGEHDEIKCEVMFSQFTQSSEHGRTNQPRVIRIGFHLMPDAYQFRIASQFGECIAHTRIRHIHPANDAGNPRMPVGQFQQEGRFFQRIVSFD